MTINLGRVNSPEPLKVQDVQTLLCRETCGGLQRKYCSSLGILETQAREVPKGILLGITGLLEKAHAIAGEF